MGPFPTVPQHPIRAPATRQSSAKVFGMSLLSNPHGAVGNGQHMGCAGLALLAALACIEFFPDEAPQAALSTDVTRIDPAPDGRCFYSCCFLWSSTASVKKDWANTPRNNGFPISSTRLKEEERSWFDIWFVLHKSL